MVKFPGLASLMAAYGMHKKDLAVLIGKAPSAVTEKLEGKTDWKWKEILAITAHFKKYDQGLTSDKIFCERGNYSEQQTA